MINATMDFGQVLILTASLSFLGLGATPPSPEWGLMIDDGTQNFYQWWISLGPGLAILTRRDGRQLPRRRPARPLRRQGPRLSRWSEPLLSIRDLRVTFGARDRRAAAGGARRRPRRRRRRAGRRRRRVRARARASRCSPCSGCSARTPRPPGRCASTATSCSARRRPCCGASAGGRIGTIFQDPLTSLNPAHTIGDQLAEAVLAHHPRARKRAKRRRRRPARAGVDPRRQPAAAGLPPRALGRHAPAGDDRHGAGQRPRAADRRRADHRARRHDPGPDPRRAGATCSASRDLAVVLVTHDLGVVAGLAERVNVMYAGRVVERGDAVGVFHRQNHPYTRGPAGVPAPARPAPRPRADRRARPPSLDQLPDAAARSTPAARSPSTAAAHELPELRDVRRRRRRRATSPPPARSRHATA